MQLHVTAIAFLMALSLIACKPDVAASDVQAAGSISADQFVSSRPPGALVLDVRTPEEYANGHIENAINIPHDQLAARLGELAQDKSQPVIVYCERGGRAGKAAEVLGTAGYSAVLHLEGDMSGWRSEGRPMVQR